MTSWTNTDLTNIESAIASGALSVEIAGKRVTYRSITELEKARDMIQAALGVSPPIIRQIRFHPKGGF
jgi:hypothetical protein